MRKYLQILKATLLTLTLLGCSGTRFDQGQGENDSRLMLEHKIFHVTDSQALPLEEEQKDNQEQASQPVTESLVDFSGVFQGIRGCAVLYSPETNQYTFYNKSLCEQQTSPCSTFKIISTLSGLRNGVLENEESRMHYTGVVYSRTAWNGDLTLKEAFQSSCVWYFHQVIDAVGESKIKAELEELSYGNCDVSEWDGSNLNSREELNGFWLGSSLEISPLEQVTVLARIFEGQSHYEDRHVEILKNIMLVSESDGKSIYGKTGTRGNGEAWFVGFREAGEEREYFAIFLNDQEQKDKISGEKAKEIAMEIFS